MTNALNSLYGDGHANATRTRECVAMPGVREQVVLTPRPIVIGLESFWNGGVEYDPCHAPGSLICARRYTRTRGLIDPWPDKTYGNPPYGKSLPDPKKQAWPWIAEQVVRERQKQAKERNKLRKSGDLPGKAERIPRFPDGLPTKTVLLDAWMNHQLEYSEGESLLLVPVRTHRKWMRSWLHRVDDALFLDPLAFHGEKQSAPFPLVLGYVSRYTNPRIDKFREAFAHVGEPIW